MKDGYGEHEICFKCRVTNDETDEFKIKIKQQPLVCDSILLAATLPTLTKVIQHPYVNLGTGKVMNLSEFFTYSQIDGCDLTCNYGDSCGAAPTTTLKAKTTVANIPIFTSPTTLTWAAPPGGAPNPYILTALNDVIEGYSPQDVCLHCTSNNLQSITEFT